MDPMGFVLCLTASMCLSFLQPVDMEVNFISRESKHRVTQIHIFEMEQSVYHLILVKTISTSDCL